MPHQPACDRVAAGLDRGPRDPNDWETAPLIASPVPEPSPAKLDQLDAARLELVKNAEQRRLVREGAGEDRVLAPLCAVRAGNA